MIKKSVFIIGFIIQFAIAICLSTPLSGAKESNSEYKISFSHKIIRQGDVVAVHITAPFELTSFSGRFNDNPVFFNKNEERNIYTGFMGIDMTLTPGRHYLNLIGKHEDKVVAAEVEINVKKRVYEIEKLSFPENQVELDDETGRRAIKEAEAIKKVWENIIDERLWRGRFELPVNGKFKPNFGTRRILNGTEKSPHNGVDISASEGTTITSPNRGRVVLIDEHFFGGKTIVLDHGQGLYTAYLHLAEISVKQGDIINKGDQLGSVGKTGRTKGPHLHWSARLNNARIDPLKLLDIRDSPMRLGQ